MKRYRVELEATHKVVLVDVDAESEGDAEEKAFDTWDVEDIFDIKDVEVIDVTEVDP